MANVDISINGRVFAVACDPGQEARVRELAAMIDTRVRRLAAQSPPGSTNETHLLVMAGLMLADELSEAQAGGLPAVGEAEGDQELLVAAVDHLTDRIEVVAARLERA